MSFSLLKRVGSGIRRRVGNAARRRALERLAVAQGCTIERELKPRKVYLVRRGDRQCVLKLTNATNITVVRDILPVVARSLTTVRVPQHIMSGEDPNLGGWIITDWIAGRSFNERWSECDPRTSGGQAIGLQYVGPFLDTLEQISGVSISGVDVEGIRVTPEIIDEKLARGIGEGTSGGWLEHGATDGICRLAEPMKAVLRSAPTSLTNGDFQLRNLVELDNSALAVIDWDTARASTVEKEHVCSYQWLLMWDHPEWQRELIRQAQDRFGMSRDVFRGALIVNALMRAYTWRRQPELRDIHVTYLERAVDDAAFDRLWRTGSFVSSN